MTMKTSKPALPRNTPTLRLEYADQPGAQALIRLLKLCNRHVGGGTRPIAAFLTNLHNVQLANADLYLLCRRVDDDHFEDVVSVMRWFRDAPGRVDLQDTLDESCDALLTMFELFGYAQ